MLAGDVEGVEEFLKSHSNYGPLFCAWERIKKELAVVQKPIAQQLQAKIRAIVLETEEAQNGNCDAGEILTDLVADLRVLSAM